MNDDIAQRMRNAAGQMSRLAWELDEAKRAWRQAIVPYDVAVARGRLLQARQNAETFLARHWRD